MKNSKIKYEVFLKSNKKYIKQDYKCAKRISSTNSWWILYRS